MNEDTKKHLKRMGFVGVASLTLGLNVGSSIDTLNHLVVEYTNQREEKRVEARVDDSNSPTGVRYSLLEDQVQGVREMDRENMFKIGFMNHPGYQALFVRPGEEIAYAVADSSLVAGLAKDRMKEE